MLITDCDNRYGAEVANPKIEWRSLGERSYVCRAVLCAEEDGGYSAYASRLPGVVSEGDSESDAIANITDAFQSAIQSYLESGEPIPWQSVSLDKPVGCSERWVLVNV